MISRKWSSVILFLWLTVVLYIDSGSIGFQCYMSSMAGYHCGYLWYLTAASYRSESVCQCMCMNSHGQV